jgi:hypothetical protein
MGRETKGPEKRRGRKIKKEGTLAILNFRGFFYFFGSDNMHGT